MLHAKFVTLNIVESGSVSTRCCLTVFNALSCVNYVLNVRPSELCEVPIVNYTYLISRAPLLTLLSPVHFLVDV